MNRRLSLTSSNPVENLRIAKYIQLKGVIRNIGADPFNCTYWTPEQVHKFINDNDKKHILTIAISKTRCSFFKSFFLMEILLCVDKKPAMIVTDFSKAFQIAVALSYANYEDLKHYLKIVWIILMENQLVDLPKCCLALDVNHFINISKWKCLKRKHTKVRQLFTMACSGFSNGRCF